MTWPSLEVRRDCDIEYLRRVESFIRHAAQDRPFFVYFNHSLAHAREGARPVQGQTSRREGYVYWTGREMPVAKSRSFTLVLVEQRYLSDSASKLPTPGLINLVTDRQEREPVSLPQLHTWTAYHLNKFVKMRLTI